MAFDWPARMSDAKEDPHDSAGLQLSILAVLPVIEPDNFAWLYLQRSCCHQWYDVLVLSDQGAVAAAPVRCRIWSAAENEAVLAAGKGKTGTCTDAFWKKACRDCPILRARGPVRCHRLPCIVGIVGVQSTADGHHGGKQPCV